MLYKDIALFIKDSDGEEAEKDIIVFINTKLDKVIKSTVKKALTASGANGSTSFTAPTDYTAVAGSPDAAANWSDAEVVFVGYGIDAPEQNWDDYQGVDLRGKVLLVMNNDPADDPNRFAGETRLYYGRWSYKFEEAARRGAIHRPVRKPGQRSTQRPRSAGLFDRSRLG